MEPYENLLIDPQLLFDDRFGVSEPGIPWEVTAAGVTATRTTADGEWDNDGGALKVVTSTTASQVSQVRRRVQKPFTGARVLAFGGRFAAADENEGSLELNLTWRDGVNAYQHRLRHTFASNLWEVDLGGAGASAFSTVLTRDTDETAAEARWHDFLICLATDPAREVRSSQVGGKLTGQAQYAKDTAPLLAYGAIDGTDYSGTVAGQKALTAADATFPGFVDLGLVFTNLGGTPVASTFFFDRLFCAYGK